MNAQDWIDRLGLQPHPEGGWYKETYRASFQVTPQGETAATDAVTSIYYLLRDEERSAWHRIAYPELWYFHDGVVLELHEKGGDGAVLTRRLGNGPGCELALVVEPGTWFSANVEDKKGYCLVSCAVAPGFRFEVFELENQKN